MLKTGFVVGLILMMFLGSNGQAISDTLNRLNKDGQKIGYWKKYNEDGLLVYEGRFELDIPIGNFIYYYPDENVKAKSFFYDNGTRTKTSTFHYSGVLMTMGFYHDKKKDSLWYYYDMSGTLLKQEFYRDNKKDGQWIVFYPDSLIQEEISWNDSKTGRKG